MSLLFQLVIPAYNESKTLEELVDKTILVAKKNGFNPSSFRLVIVNNGSKDGTRGVLHKLLKSEKGKWIRAVHIEKNQGYGDGVYEGLCATEAPYVGWTHADLQCDPEDAFRAYEILKKHPSQTLVKGKRIQRKITDTLFTLIFETLASVILMERLSEINAQPKIFTRDLLSFLPSPPKDFAFDVYVLYQAKRARFKIFEIPVIFPERKSGVSHWSSQFILKYLTILKMLRYLFRLKLSPSN